jgi:CRISPR-associated protein Cas1
MIGRTIEISSAARLSVAHRQLIIERNGHPAASVPIEDIGILVVDNPAVSYSHTVFTALAEAGGIAVLCDKFHLPCVLMQPQVGHTTQTERQRAQTGAPEALRERLWGSLVASKLRMQALVLAETTGSEWGMTAMAGRVRPGDPTNLEAQGAQRYFARVFGSGFRRDRGGDAPNHLLNYGYMVVRAAVARGLAGSGLLPSLGLHHRNRGNPFCLADDMIEPYRPLIDYKVLGLIREGRGNEELGPYSKQVLLSVFNEVVPTSSGVRNPVSLTIQRGAASLAQAFMSGTLDLTVPTGLPVSESDDGDEEDNDT